MLRFLLTLLSLTVTLTLTASAALLFRRTPAAKAGGNMSAVWVVVLCLAVLPIPLPSALSPPPLLGEPNSGAQIELPAVLLPARQNETAAATPATPEPGDASVSVPAPIAPRTALLLPFVIALWGIGAAAAFFAALRRARRLDAALRAASSPCDMTQPAMRALAERIYRLADEAGLRRSPALRIFDAGLPLPPARWDFSPPASVSPRQTVFPPSIPRVPSCAKPSSRTNCPTSADVTSGASCMPLRSAQSTGLIPSRT